MHSLQLKLSMYEKRTLILDDFLNRNYLKKVFIFVFLIANFNQAPLTSVMNIKYLHI